MSKLHRVVVTGMGAITPYGSGIQLFQESIKAGYSGLEFDKSLGFLVGRIPAGSCDFERWTAGQRREMSRASQIALLAAEETLMSANAEKVGHNNTLVSVGTGVSDLELIGETAQHIKASQARKVSPYFVPRILNNIPAGYIAMKYGMMGGVESASTACATGLHCIGNAYRAVRHGWSRRALAGATEACVNQIAITGFDRMRALARGESQTISRPFDKERSGFVLSEGAGLLFLERLEDALEREAPIHAEIVGYGVSSDAYHISSPHPSGIGAFTSMQRALQDGGVPFERVSYVNAHATSTPTGDSIEAKAVAQLLVSPVAVSSVKGHIGHLLAAAGAVETLATVVAVRDGWMPGNLNLGESNCEEGIRLLRQTENWSEPANESGAEEDKWAGRRIAVVNSFGFGATNASIVLSSYK